MEGWRVRNSYCDLKIPSSLGFDYERAEKWGDKGFEGEEPEESVVGRDELIPIEGWPELLIPVDIGWD